MVLISDARNCSRQNSREDGTRIGNVYLDRVQESRAREPSLTGASEHITPRGPSHPRINYYMLRRLVSVGPGLKCQRQECRKRTG
jgi:hypothetical protein